MGVEDSKMPVTNSSKTPLSRSDIFESKTPHQTESNNVSESKTPIVPELVTNTENITDSNTETLESLSDAEFTERVYQFIDRLPKKVREMVEAAGDSIDEIVRDPRFRKMVAIGLAAAVASSLVPWNLARESKDRVEIKPEPKESNDLRDINQEIIDETAAAAREIGELVMFENVKPRINKTTSPYYEKAVRYVEDNKDLRGAERHAAMVDIYAEQMHDIIEAKNNSMNSGDIETLELIRMATYHELNAKVKAGDYTDIVEAGIKVGKISPEKAQEAIAALSRSGKDIQIDTESMTAIVDGQTLKISEDALFGQIIGNEVFYTEIAENQGTALGAGVYDMEKLDPNSAAEIKKDPEVVRQLVQSNWSQIADNLRSKGVDVDGDPQKYFDIVVESIISGSSQEIVLDTSDERSVLMDQGDFDVFGWQVDIQTQLKEIFNLPILPSVRIEMSKIEEFKEARAVMSTDVDIFAGHISKEMLCEGNYSLIIQIGDININVGPAVLEKVIRTGDINILWFAIIPFLIPPARRPEPVPMPEPMPPVFPKKEMSGPDIKGGDIVGHQRRGGKRVKEKAESERHHPGGQATLGGNRYTPGGTDKNPSIGRINRNQESRFNKSGAKSRHKHS